MNTTNILLVVILFILVKQFYPETAGTLIAMAAVGLVSCGCYWLIAEFPGRYRKRKEEKRQAAEDEKEYWEYHQKHDAIRTKYDPGNEWNEATSIPRKYLEEIRELNMKHGGMLRRRNDGHLRISKNNASVKLQEAQQAL